MKILFQHNVQSPALLGPNEGDDDELLIANYKGNLKVLKMLMEYRNQRGYRSNAASYGGDKPIHCAAAGGH
jgi:hypothetical protein